MFKQPFLEIVGYSRLQKLEKLVAEVKKKLNVKNEFEIFIEIDKLKKTKVSFEQTKLEDEKRKTKLALENEQKTKSARKLQKKTIKKGKRKFKVVNTEAVDKKVDDKDSIVLTSQTPGYLEPKHTGKNTVTNTAEFKSTSEYASIIKEGLKHLDNDTEPFSINTNKVHRNCTLLRTDCYNKLLSKVNTLESKVEILEAQVKITMTVISKLNNC